ncbi:hypothetical protein [Phytomonospora endophytica]|uniref:Uncharacterized protein n=1 Tax=Phytomonospora endophytica TaxID=714109 RepID=A0A841FK40_9ACTN|nr:hypothetical protein [Phytomonospora endophytica]MBB6033932.1 hypothetical protein [Phytomonospora endophytica]GIG64547.1 hypothetical protein Pen01_08420 [Phytomonospora endophytica]
MTEPSGGIPDTGPLNYRLWLPRWDTHNGRLRTRLQVTTMGLTQINEGTTECMTAILEELGQPEAKNVTWSCERYRTPYFSDFTDAEAWEDRLAMAWSVTIETDNDVDPEDGGSHDPGPHGSHAHDSTFADEDEDWERTRERVIVIAGRGYGPEIDAAPLEEIDGVRSADTGVFEGMVALDLGELDFPEALPKVEAVVARCQELGLPTTWGR